LLSTLTFLIIFLFFTIPVKAETEKIKNPSWVKIPGTEPSTQDIKSGFDEPAFLNINGIIKKGGIITYDIVDPNASYSRLQTNCTTKNFRAIRVGEFNSNSIVKYQNIIGEWEKASELYHILIVEFVCSL
ncbi:MAG: hypothetical protein ACK5GT_14715, partial [Aphanizomenon sp.]